MAIVYNTSIVRSGLVVHLDAANPKSYPGSGTTWNDLSGNSDNSTLTNSPTYDSTNKGSFVFNGTNYAVQTTSKSTAVTEATFTAWMKRNGSQSEYAGIVFCRGVIATGFNFYSTNNTLGYHWNNGGPTYTYNSGLLVPDGAWCMVAVTITSTAATFYLCQNSGITTATNITAHASTTLNLYRIGSDSGAVRLFNGNMSSASIYNRALTALDINQNFEATRGRYGV